MRAVLETRWKAAAVRVEALEAELERVLVDAPRRTPWIEAGLIQPCRG